MLSALAALESIPSTKHVVLSVDEEFSAECDTIVNEAWKKCGQPRYFPKPVVLPPGMRIQDYDGRNGKYNPEWISRKAMIAALKAAGVPIAGEKGSET